MRTSREVPAVLRFGFSRPQLGALASAEPTVDDHGPVDAICAGWVRSDSPAAMQVAAMESSGLQEWSYKNFGVPYYAPSVVTSAVSWQLGIIGAFVGGFHGHARSGGNTMPMLLWGLAGFVFPLPTAAAAVITGYGQKKRTS